MSFFRPFKKQTTTQKSPISVSEMSDPTQKSPIYEGLFAQVLFFLSYYGIIYALLSVPTDLFLEGLPIELDMGRIHWLVFAYCSLRWVLTVYRVKIAAIPLVAGLGYLAMQWRGGWQEALILYDNVVHKGPLPTSLNWVVLVAALVVAEVLFQVMVNFGQRWLVNAIIITVGFLGPYLGIPITLPFYFLLTFILIVNMIATSAKSSKLRHMGQKDRSKFKVVGKSVVVATGLFCALFALFTTVLSDSMDQLLALPTGIENEVRRYSLNQTKTDESDLSGTINRGNNYPDGKDQLEVSVSTQPNEPLYLKSQSFGDYIGNEWDRLDERAFFDGLYETYGADDTSFQYYMLNFGDNQSFDERFYMTFDAVNTKKEAIGEATPQANSVRTRRLDKLLKAPTVPYLSKLQVQGERGNLYTVYDDNTYENYQEDLKQLSQFDWFREVEGRYAHFVQERYTEVDRSMIPRLADLIDEELVASGDKDAIQREIIQQLHTRARYSLTPGVMPVGSDVSEAFLFDLRAGYCQHFASAATLMFRLYGIPARYVSGYRANTSDFLSKDNGDYEAILSDEQAHAWVELYDETRGWYPVEVTPEENSILFDEDLDKDSSEAEGNSISWLAIDPKTITKAVTIFLAILLLVVITLAERYHRKQVKRESLKADAYFQELLKSVQFTGKLAGYTGVEEDFVDQLAAVIKSLDSSEKTETTIYDNDLQQVMTIVMKESFGPKSVSEEERQTVKKTVSIIQTKLYDSLRPDQRLVFKYIKCYK